MTQTQKPNPSEGMDFPASWVLIRPLRDPDGIPASVRVRRALKGLLRGYRIKVEKVSGFGPDITETSEGCNASEKS